jgi:hypothetical protein
MATIAVWLFQWNHIGLSACHIASSVTSFPFEATMSVTQEQEPQQPAQPGFNREAEVLHQDIERRRMIMIICYAIWNLASLSFFIMPLLKLAEVESHYPYMFANFGLSFFVLLWFWRRHPIPDVEAR